MPRSGVSRPEQASERAALVEQDEDHGRTGKCDQGQCREIGDQMEIKTHGTDAELQLFTAFRLRGIRPDRTVGVQPL